MRRYADRVHTAFGPYLREALDKAGMSQRAFARAVGYKQANIQQVVAGRRKPPLRHARRWAKALGTAVTLDDFEERVHLAHISEVVLRLINRLRAAANEDTHPGDRLR